MSDKTKHIKALFSKLDSDVYNLEEESLLAIEDLEDRITELENALNEAAECLDMEGINEEANEYRAIAKGNKQ